MTDKCPHCGAEIKDQAGVEAQCPVCGEIQAPEAPRPAPSAQPPLTDQAQAAPAIPGDQPETTPTPSDTPALQEPLATPADQTGQNGFTLPPAGTAGTQGDQYQAPHSAAQPQAAAPSEDLTSYSPAWEGDATLFKGLWRTIWSVLLHPVKSFRAPALPGHAWALSFGLILGTFGMALQALWSRVFNQPDMIPLPPLWWLILSPLVILAAIYFNAGIAHLGLIMVGGAKRGFSATLRVVGYSEAAAIFYLVPFLGMAVGGVWELVVLIGGLAGAHDISGWRVVWAYALLFIIFAAIVAIVVLILGTGMVLGLLGHFAGKGSML